jgi:hypothetical protein
MHKTLPVRSSALLRSVLLAGAVLSCAAALSCGSKEDDSEETGGKLELVDVCMNALKGKCGNECEETENCPSGQFCSDGACTAHCTATLGCDGTCTAEGKCDGTRQMVPTMTETNPDDVLVSDPSDMPGGNFEACATGQTAGEITPVVMYVMFDRSSSMKENQKWDRATAGLTQFFQDAASAELSVVYGVFPTETGGCNMDECVAETCGQPLVQLGTLSAASGADDAQEDALVRAIDMDDPSGGGLGTPTGAALTGALVWATDYQANHANESAVVVLVTDGEPDGCGDAGELERIVSGGLGTSGIRTYAIGLQGSQEDTMDRIARAGGTEKGIFIGDGDATTDLLAALNTIRGEAASCNVVIPDQGDSDPDKVNVTLTLSGDDVEIARVDAEGDCKDNGAWYYDNNDKPTRLLLCPATCDAVQKDPDSRIDIVLGCAQTIVPAPIAR